MDAQLLMKTAVMAGELMLSSGAETYRVENTMYLMLNTAEDMELAEVFVIMTGITATLKVKDRNSISYVKRVNNRSTNMNCILEVNSISRAYCGKELTLEEAYQKLKDIKRKVYTPLEKKMSVVGICMGFSIFFGGSLIDVFSTMLVGIFLIFCMWIGEKLHFQSFLQDVFNSFGISCASILLYVFIKKVNLDTVIISSIMPLVPGVAITNAVRDTLQGDYISGCARILEAFLKAAAIAIGIAIGILGIGSMVF